MHKSWKFWASLAGIGLLAVVIDIKTGRKLSGLLTGLPVVGGFLTS